LAHLFFFLTGGDEMAIAAALNSAWEARIEGQQEGQQTVNVFHFVCVGPTADVELHLIQVLLTCFITHLLPVLSQYWSLKRIVWRQVSPVLGLDQISVPVGQDTGGTLGPVEPSFVAAVLSLRTLYPGRSGRGRKYIPGIPETATIGSNFDPAAPFWNGLVAFALCLVTEFVHPDPAGGSDMFDISVYSRKQGGTVLPYPIAAFHAIREIVPVDRVATQRSRKLGRGA
jgi:hypothetical protein